MADRQAVLFIHGIGEQRPMETLRSFVDAVWRDHKEIHHPFATENARTLIWSKPDSISDTFELRRLTTPQNLAGIRTDFFEFYWQHLMEGTTYGHVIGWGSTLLLRRPRNVPRRLRLAYWLLWTLVVLTGILLLYTSIAARSTASAVPWWLSTAFSVLFVPLVGVVIKGTVGDAARYLHPAPANVQRRHAIRQAGVTVLEALHQRDYDRIIIVGHSLGSVIGYDLLTHCWPSFSRWEPTHVDPSMIQLDVLENLAAEDKASSEVIHRAQRAYFEESVKDGCAWRVTDFLTLGSPLAHAELLLARDRADLVAKQEAREMPTCPPALEHTTRNNVPVSRFSFVASGHRPDGYRMPHHAAVFGPTRWTNLYFSNRAIIVGDLIGGPLAGTFGRGVRDFALTTTLRGGLLSHTLYWKQTKDSQVAPHIATLRRALDLLDNGGVVPLTSAAAEQGARASEAVSQR